MPVFRQNNQVSIEQCYGHFPTAGTGFGCKEHATWMRICSHPFSLASMDMLEMRWSYWYDPPPVDYPNINFWRGKSGVSEDLRIVDEKIKAANDIANITTEQR